MKKSIYFIFAAYCMVGILALGTGVQAQINISDVVTSGSVSCSLFSESSGLGSKDAGIPGKVRMLQQVLKQGGYMTTNPTGYFGMLTQDAVKKFQTANKIPSTGFVGPLTLAKLKASCESGLTTETPVSLTFSARTEKSEYTQNEDIKIILKAQNKTNKPQILSFTTGCQSTYIIGTYNPLAGKVCAPALSSSTVKAREGKDWVMTHRVSDKKLSLGTYVVTATLTGYGSATTTVTIK